MRWNVNKIKKESEHYLDHNTKTKVFPQLYSENECRKLTELELKQHKENTKILNYIKHVHHQLVI